MVTTQITAHEFDGFGFFESGALTFQYIMSGHLQGTLMRYFLFLSFSKPLLTVGIMEAS